MSSRTTAYERTPQQPVGSGFGKDSTAADVLAGLDLAGVSAVVTGGYSGIGLETTRALSAAGAAVLVPARRPDHARDQLTGMDRVDVDELDLADLDSVRDFADRLLASGRPVDILINNAAVMANVETRVGPGWESQFATNHLGHFALTNRLWPALASRGARVVSVSSVGHQSSGIRWDDVHFQRGYDKWAAYGQAKTANVLFAVELDRLASPDGVRALSLMPGGIRTPLQRHLDDDEMVQLGWSTRRATTFTTGRPPSRARRRSCGPRRPRGSPTSAGCTARTSRSPSWPTRAVKAASASARTRSTRSRPGACGRCPPS